MLTEDILHDLQKENIVFQKEYTRQIYDTNAFLSTGSCLKDSSVIYIKIKRKSLRKGGILWIIPLRFQI